MSGVSKLALPLEACYQAVSEGDETSRVESLALIHLVQHGELADYKSPLDELKQSSFCPILVEKKRTLFIANYPRMLLRSDKLAGSYVELKDHTIIGNGSSSLSHLRGLVAPCKSCYQEMAQKMDSAEDDRTKQLLWAAAHLLTHLEDDEIIKWLYHRKLHFYLGKQDSIAEAEVGTDLKYFLKQVIKALLLMR